MGAYLPDIHNFMSTRGRILPFSTGKPVRR